LPALQDCVKLAAGDGLVIFSDGIPEAMSESGNISANNGLLNAL
jgi:serine phosphatase RsbU (regulator of sigma subunit)